MDATSGLITDRAPLLRRRDPVLWIGLALFAFQAFLALRFYLERTATADSSFFSFLMLDSGKPVEALGRYGSWLAQLIPLALIHLKAPLAVVLKAYSLCFVLLDVAIFLVLALRLRDREATIALPLVKTVAFHYTFYYGISELNQGLSLMVLVWALLKRHLPASGRRPWPLIGIFLLVVWSSFYHQLLVFPLMFALGLEFQRSHLWRDRKAWGLGFVLLAWFAVRILFFTRSAYEAQRMPSLEEIWVHGRNLLDLPSTQHLLSVFAKFKAFLLLALITTVLAIRLRILSSLIWTMLFSAGFLMLVLITDREGRSPNIYENYYTVLGFYWAVLFARSVVTAERRLWVPVMCSLILLLGSIQVWRAHSILTAHVRYAIRITDTLRERGTHKAVSDPMNFPWRYAWGEWPLAMETALASARHAPEEACTVFAAADLAPFDAAMESPVGFLGPSWNPVWFTTNHFPRAQLHFPRQPYVRMNNVMPDSVEADFVASDIELVAAESEITLAHDRFTVAEVWITNRSQHTLGSMLANGIPMRLSYHLLNDDGTMFMSEGQRTELEIDIPPGTTHLQGLIIERPVPRGTYHVQIDLVTEGKRWWGIDAPLVVHAGW